MQDIFKLIGADSCGNRRHYEKLMTFGQFVGGWTIESIWYSEDGEARRTTGQWHFGWILGGNGVQDVLFADDYPPDQYGITVRCYDHQKDLWRVSWMQPGNGEFANLIGRPTDTGIEQEVVGLSDKQEIWRFADINDDTFAWTDEVSYDDGRTWRIEQRMYGKRAR